MKKHAKLIHGNDNVVTGLSDIQAGGEFFVKTAAKEERYQANQDVPFGHKIAIADIDKDEAILKYGAVIGVATQKITKGDWVHTHNVKDNYEVK
jgi:altronate dehydratase small subunit